MRAPILFSSAAEILHMRLAGRVEERGAPRASVAAIRTFSVAVTLASSSRMSAPRKFAPPEVEAHRRAPSRCRAGRGPRSACRAGGGR